MREFNDRFALLRIIALHIRALIYNAPMESDLVEVLLVDSERLGVGDINLSITIYGLQPLGLSGAVTIHNFDARYKLIGILNPSILNKN